MFNAPFLARSVLIHLAVQNDSPGVLRFGLESCEGERKVIIEKISLGANFIGFGLFHLEVVDHRRCRFATARRKSVAFRSLAEQAVGRRFGSGIGRVADRIGRWNESANSQPVTKVTGPDTPM